ncbi:polysaccharide biosynthesis/export family protein [Microvirga calopogonii]|uniref:polysaccharide biosynthesis/export family protein n=1 Tax=Microvirga calopogonii TaxID=2078013 RepID=UPI0013B39D7A|nr:polysaccharide biosynthesis/export family protein [Microvirga calopogonii]
MALADSPGYELGPQDKIRVSVIEWFTGAGELRSPINGEYMVNPNGFISLPLVGDVKALGLEPSFLAAQVSEKLQAKLSLSERPITSIEIVQFRPFFVMGDLERPGEYAYRPGITALQAVSLAGGLYRASAPTPVQVQREAIQAASERRSLSARIAELAIRRVRLEAELKNAEVLEFSPDIQSRKADPAVAAAMRLESTIFDARRRAFSTSINVQKKLIDLYGQEILALKAQAESLERHRDATRQQAENLRSLQARGLATMGREFDIDRMFADVAIRKQELDAKSLRLQQELVKAENATQEVDARRRQEIAAELQTLQGTLDEFEQRLLLADQTLTETELRPSGSQHPAFTLIRQDASGKETEIAAMTATPLQPGDILIVRAAQPIRPNVAARAVEIGLAGVQVPRDGASLTEAHAAQ